MEQNHIIRQDFFFLIVKRWPLCLQISVHAQKSLSSTGVCPPLYQLNWSATVAQWVTHSPRNIDDLGSMKGTPAKLSEIWEFFFIVFDEILLIVTSKNKDVFTNSFFAFRKWCRPVFATTKEMAKCTSITFIAPTAFTTLSCYIIH